MKHLLRVKRYLAESYPYYWWGRGLLRMLCLIVVASFVFNYAFQPFVVYTPEHKMDFVWICLIHAVVPGIVGYLYFSVINLFATNEDRWTIGNEVFYVLIFFLLVGLGSFLVRDIIYDNPKNWSLQYLYEEIRNTFMIGVLFALVFVPLNLSRLQKKYKHGAATLHTAVPVDPMASTGDHLVFIKTQVKNDDFRLEVNRLLFAKAAGNYVEIFTERDGEIEMQLKRIPIKVLESQLAKFSYIVKTHRAYLVNTQRVSQVRGNAQGYQLSFHGMADTVPVARSMIAVFNAAMKP